MKSKMFEVRDAGTCMTVIAIKTEGENEKERAHFRRGGWGENSIILMKTNGEVVANYDAFEWRNRNNRTLFNAHRYIEENFDNLNNFDVIDVQYILGETESPKQSEIIRDAE